MSNTQQRAEALFPCNCERLKDGSHQHWCQSQYAEWVVEEFEKDESQLAAADAQNAKLHEALEIYASEDVWWKETPTKFVWNLDCFPYEDARIALGMIEASAPAAEVKP